MGYHKNLLSNDNNEYIYKTEICKNCGEEFKEEWTRTTNWDGTHDTDIEVIKNCKCGRRKRY